MTDPGIIIDNIGGYCPVQAEGTIDGVPFYFRARGERWSLSVADPDPLDDDAWLYQEPYGTEKFAAGYMDLDETRAFIIKAAGLYRAALTPPGGES